MNQYKPVLTIEHLPNEIFFDIFQYINVYDLHTIWSKFNQRFKILVHSVRMYIHLIEKNDYENYEYCLDYYALQFTYIRIDKNCERLQRLNLNQFLNIRSLHLNIISYEQYDQITPDNMPYLTYLTIHLLYPYRKPSRILFGSKQFVHLKTCLLPYFDPIDTFLQPCLTLRSLYLNVCSKQIFFKQIKILLPNLVYFGSVFGGYLTFDNINENEENMLIPHKKLRHVKIELDKNVTLDFLPLILTVLPNLYYLELYCRYYCDYQQVADLLQTKLLQLKQFHFIVNESRYQRLPDIKILKTMSPWFDQIKIEQNGINKQINCYIKK